MKNKLLEWTSEQAIEYLESIESSPISPVEESDDQSNRWDESLPHHGCDEKVAIESLIEKISENLQQTQSPRYFGFVIGGASEVSIAADWLTSSWDQNGHCFLTSPASAKMEQLVEKWILEILDLPRSSSIGFVTGAQMGNFTALKVAVNEQLKQYGWDAYTNGIQGAPHINIFCGGCCHGTIHSSLQMMGLGVNNVRIIPVDKQGKMNPKDLEKLANDCPGPKIICAQAGNVNTGAFDSFDDLASVAKKHNTWLHVDGAFGLWARASNRLKHLCKGVELADSWSTDAHKWLNVPHDSGLVIIKKPCSHKAMKKISCAYAGSKDAPLRNGSEFTPENTRRARSFVLYAALKHFGKTGVSALVDRSCENAKSLESLFQKIPDATIINDVVLNQLIVRLEPKGIANLDEFNDNVTARVQKKGICWFGNSVWNGKKVLRFSISNAKTTANDIQRSFESIKQAIHEEVKSAGAAQDGQL